MMYAQFDENGICFCVGTPNITGVPATYDNIGMKYENGVWVDPNAPKEEKGEIPTDIPVDEPIENTETKQEVEDNDKK